VLARLFEQAIESATGERAVVGSVDISPLTGVVRVDGLVIQHRSEDPLEDGMTVASVASLRAALGWERGLRLQSLRLERPRVRLHLDADGLRELGGLGSGGDKEPGALDPDDVISVLEIHDGRFELEAEDAAVRLHGLRAAPDPAGGARLVVESVYLRSGALEQRARDLTLPGVRVTTDRVVLPDISVAFDDVRVEGQAAAALNGPLNGHLSLQVDLAPLIGRQAPAVTGTADVDVALGGDLSSPEISGGVLLGGVRVGDSPEIPQVHARWAWASPEISFERLETRWAEGHLTASGAIDPFSGAVRAQVATEGLSLAAALTALGASEAPWVELEIDGEAAVSGTVRPLALAADVTLAGTDLRVAGGPVATHPMVFGLPRLEADALVEISTESVAVDVSHVASPWSAGTARALFDLGTASDPGGGASKKHTMDLSARLHQLTFDELRPLGGLELSGHGAGAVRVHGPLSSLRVDGAVSARRLALEETHLADRISARLSSDLRTLRLDDVAAVVGGTAYGGQFAYDFTEGRLTTDVRWDDGRVEDLLTVAGTSAPVDGRVGGAMRLWGDPSALDGEVSLELTDVDLLGERFDTGGGRARLDAGMLTINQLSLSRAFGQESVLLRGSVRPSGELSLGLVTGGLVLEEFDQLVQASPRLRGRLDVDAWIEGTTSAPEVRGRVTLRDTWVGRNPIGDSTLELAPIPGGIAVRGDAADAAIAVDGHVALSGAAEWELTADLVGVPLHVFRPVAADGRPIRSLLTGEARASGALRAPRALADLNLTAQAVSLSWGTYMLSNRGPVSLHISQDGRVVVDDLAMVGGQTSFSFSGQRAPDGRVALVGGGQIELGLLPMVVPDLQRAAGVAQVDVAVSGAPGSRRTLVRAELSDGLLAGAWFPASFEEIGGVIEATADGYAFHDVSGRLGGGTWSGSGRIAAQDWVPERYDLQATVRGARVRYFDDLPPFVGDASLTFDGPVGDLLLSGQLDITQMTFAERIDWEDWLLEVSSDAPTAAGDTANYFDLGLDVIADRTILVRNNVGALTASARLKVIGDTSRVGMVGEVRAEPGGRVLFKEREFEIERAELHFSEPYAFDPALDLALVCDLRGAEDEYTVHYLISGSYSDWYASTSSDPSLPQADINALLLFGMTRDELERYGGLGEALFVEGGDLLASKLVSQGIYELEFLPGERWRPQRIDLVSGTGDRASGTITTELRVLAEWDLGADTTLIVEQSPTQWSESYVAVEKRLAQKLYARSYWSGEREGGSLGGQGAVGVEARLRWEMD